MSDITCHEPAPLLPSCALLLLLATSGRAQPAAPLPDLATLQDKLARPASRSRG